MISEKVQWIRRNTLDGEIYYDRSTRNVYRSRPKTTLGDDQFLWSLPTFEYEAPLKVYFDFTYLCNLECRHCITNSSPRVEITNELNADKIKSIMNELASVGVLELGIGGGEPFCHTELFSLLSYAHDLQLNTVLTSNGLLVTSEIAKRIKNAGVSEVRISFEGCQTVHDGIRGAGSYRKALKGASILIDCGVTTVPRLTISKDDESGLDSLFTELKSIGATVIKASLIEPRGRASLSENKDLFRYNRDTNITNILLEIAHRHDIKIKIPSDLAGSAELADGGELRLGKIKSCGAGLETAYISPSGIVQPCSGMPEYIFGDIKDETFMKIWMGQAAKAWRQRVCDNCSWCLCVQKPLSC